MHLMKVVIAIDSFKGCLSSKEANDAAVQGIREIFHSQITQGVDLQIICCPISDGGEGLTEAFGNMDIECESVSVNVHGPLMDPIIAKYLIIENKTAIMEMAAACGLPLVPIDKRNPEKTTTYGFGEMLADAMRRGCKNYIVGIGGSATNDAGAGMIEALKANRLFENRTLFNPETKIYVACDVQNPLFGENGAAYIFAPQKGADAAMVERLDKRLRDFYIASGCTDSVAGDGAAGGLGFALRYFLGAKLKPGIEVVLDALDFDRTISDADLIITGEGKCDQQTLMGKVPYGILKRAKKQEIPVVLIAGKTDDKEVLIGAGFKDVLCINNDDNRPLEILMQPEVAKINIIKTIKQSINI